MTVIAKDHGVVSIDVVVPEPAATGAVLADLERATETLMRRPGFVSANLHRSKDGTRVANYVQWRSRADFEAQGHSQGTLYEVAHVQQAGPAVTIATGTTPWTLIVVMSCEPAEQDELTAYLVGIAQEHSVNPGFISCTIHRSLDGTHVAEYIQWRDQAALAAMAAKPASQAHFARVKHRSSSAPYDVIATFAAAPEI